MAMRCAILLLWGSMEPTLVLRKGTRSKIFHAILHQRRMGTVSTPVHQLMGRYLSLSEAGLCKKDSFLRGSFKRETHNCSGNAVAVRLRRVYERRILQQNQSVTIAGLYVLAAYSSYIAQSSILTCSVVRNPKNRNQTRCSKVCHLTERIRKCYLPEPGQE